MLSVWIGFITLVIRFGIKNCAFLYHIFWGFFPYDILSKYVLQLEEEGPFPVKMGDKSVVKVTGTGEIDLLIDLRGPFEK